MKKLIATALLATLPLAGVAQDGEQFREIPKEGFQLSATEITLSMFGIGERRFMLKENLERDMVFDFTNAPVFGFVAYKENIGLGAEVSYMDSDFIPRRYSTGTHKVLERGSHTAYVVTFKGAYKHEIPLGDDYNIGVSGGVSMYVGTSLHSKNWLRTNLKTDERTKEVENKRNQFIGVGLEAVIHPIQIPIGDVDLGIGLKFGIYSNIVNFGEPQFKNFNYSMALSLAQKF